MWGRTRKCLFFLHNGSKRCLNGGSDSKITKPLHIALLVVRHLQLHSHIWLCESKNGNVSKDQQRRRREESLLPLCLSGAAHSQRDWRRCGVVLRSCCFWANLQHKMGILKRFVCVWWKNISLIWIAAVCVCKLKFYFKWPGLASPLCIQLECHATGGARTGEAKPWINSLCKDKVWKPLFLHGSCYPLIARQTW